MLWSKVNVNPEIAAVYDKKNCKQQKGINLLICNGSVCACTIK